MPLLSLSAASRAPAGQAASPRRSGLMGRSTGAKRRPRRDCGSRSQNGRRESLASPGRRVSALTTRGQSGPLRSCASCSDSCMSGASAGGAAAPNVRTGSGRTVTLKMKYADFQQITRSRTGQALFSTRAEIEQLSYALLEPLFPVTKGIRLLGITLSSLAEKQLESEPQLRLSF